MTLNNNSWVLKIGDKNSVISLDVTIDTESKILNSIIGQNSLINNSKITSSILMSGVIVEAGCEIMNCILGKNAVI